MVLPFKELNLVGRCKASIQMFVFYSTECEDAMGGEVGWELRGFRGRTNNESKVSFQQGTCQGS